MNLPLSFSFSPPGLFLFSPSLYLTHSLSPSLSFYVSLSSCLVIGATMINKHNRLRPMKTWRSPWKQPAPTTLTNLLCCADATRTWRYPSPNPNLNDLSLLHPPKLLSVPFRSPYPSIIFLSSNHPFTLQESGGILDRSFFFLCFYGKGRHRLASQRRNVDASLFFF